jgi:hypothetical protein
MTDFMLADKARFGVGLSVIDFFPCALDKRPGAGFADDCWYAGIVAIILFFISASEGLARALPDSPLTIDRVVAPTPVVVVSTQNVVAAMARQ